MSPTQPALLRTGRRHDASIKLAWQTGIIILLFFAAVAPTLSWPQFSGDSEDLVVQTVLQIRNGGPWWIPMLGDEPRSKKPPLPTWISAAAVTSSTVKELSSTNAATRESAYRWLAWEVRWPALLAACGILVAVAFTAYLLGGPAHVIPAVLICATSLLFLRYTRSATTDVHLALWVAVANAFLAAAIVRDRIWLGWLGAGASLGLALMCKGPVALVETLLPAAAFLLLRRRFARPAAPQPLAPSRSTTFPIIAGVLLMLAIALPWPLSVYLRQPQTLGTWLTEIDRHGASIPSHASIFAYLILLPNLLPWLPIFIAGCYLVLLNFRKTRPMALAFLMLTVPIVFMSFFPDRKDRYLLPMIGPAAIVASHAAVRMKRMRSPSASFPLNLPVNSLAEAGRPRSSALVDPQNHVERTTATLAEKLVWASRWLILLILAAGLPVIARLLFKGRDGEPCCSVTMATIALLASLGIVTAGLALRSKWPQSFLWSGAVMMLALNAFFMFTWSQSVLGLSEMKPLADRLHAAFPQRRVVYFDPPPDGKPVTLDLDIYLDRPVPVVSQFPGDDDDATAAVVMLRKDGQAVPSFAGWRVWDDLISRKHHWYILTPTPR